MKILNSYIGFILQIDSGLNIMFDGFFVNFLKIFEKERVEVIIVRVQVLV